MQPGELGEVCVRGGAVMLGYWNRPEATAETLRGGWLHTGDLGRMDEHGYVYLLDRAKDMIISGGSNVYAVEVEAALADHPAVREVAVIGVVDRTWGEIVTAVVVAEPGVDPSTLQTQLAAPLHSHPGGLQAAPSIRRSRPPSPQRLRQGPQTPATGGVGDRVGTWPRSARGGPAGAPRWRCPGGCVPPRRRPIRRSAWS